MKNITLLMTGVGGPGAGGYIYSLKQNGERNIRIIGTDIKDDIDPVTRNSIDGFYIIPKANTEPYLKELLTICRKEKVDVLLPLNTIELRYLSSHQSDFNAVGTIVCVVSVDTLDVVNNKAVLLTTLRKIGIKTPEFYVVRSVEDFESAARKLGYPEKPFVIKRPDANGSRGMRFIDAGVSRVDLYLNAKPHSTYAGYEDMIAILPEVFERTELVLMEMLTGKEYSVDTLVDHGEIMSSVCRRVDVVIDSINVDSTIVQRQDVIEYCNQISSRLCIDGFIGYDLKMTADDKPRILEINPRLQATTILSVLGGVNFPYYIVKKALGEEFDIAEPVEGIRTAQRKQKLFFSPEGDTILTL